MRGVGSGYLSGGCGVEMSRRDQVVL
jgi:hypothetical protein